MNEYEKKINEKSLDLLNNKQKYEEEIDIFIQKAVNSTFSKELSKCLNVELNQNLKQEYKKRFPVKKKNIIMTYLNESLNYYPSKFKESGFKFIVEEIFRPLSLIGGAFLNSRVGLNKEAG